MYKESSLYIKTLLLLQEELAGLPTTTIGLRLRTMQTTCGNRTSTMATRTTTIRTTQTMCVLFGILNKPVPCPDDVFGQGTFYAIRVISILQYSWVFN
jgi:hypothetical protein